MSWSLQQNIGAREALKGREHYEGVAEFVMNSLQQPCADLRGKLEIIYSLMPYEFLMLLFVVGLL